MEFEVLLLDLILTVFSYLLVPVIVIIRNKKYSIKTLKNIAIFNGVAVWFIFTIIISSAGAGTANTGAAFLWSYIGFRIMKKKSLKEETVTTNTPSSTSYGNYEVYGSDIALESDDNDE